MAKKVAKNFCMSLTECDTALSPLGGWTPPRRTTLRRRKSKRARPLVPFPPGCVGRSPAGIKQTRINGLGLSECPGEPGWTAAPWPLLRSTMPSAHDRPFDARRFKPSGVGAHLLHHCELLCHRELLCGMDRSGPALGMWPAGGAALVVRRRCSVLTMPQLLSPIFQFGSHEDRPMTTAQAFMLGIMVAWSPTLLLLAWFLYRDRDSSPMSDWTRPDPDQETRPR